MAALHNIEPLPQGELVRHGVGPVPLGKWLYRLQQAVELAMKYLLELSGIEFPKTHDIDQLIRIARTNDIDLYVSEYLDDHAEMLSLWEAKSRYILGYAIEARKVERMIQEVGLYLERIAVGQSRSR